VELLPEGTTDSDGVAKGLPNWFGRLYGSVDDLGIDDISSDFSFAVSGLLGGALLLNKPMLVVVQRCRREGTWRRFE